MPGGAGHEECRLFYQSTGLVQAANVATVFPWRSFNMGPMACQLAAPGLV